MSCGDVGVPNRGVGVCSASFGDVRRKKKRPTPPHLIPPSQNNEGQRGINAAPAAAAAAPLVKLEKKAFWPTKKKSSGGGGAGGGAVGGCFVSVFYLVFRPGSGRASRFFVCAAFVLSVLSSMCHTYLRLIVLAPRADDT